MKLKFDPSLDFQADAIQAVVKTFEGQPLTHSQFEISLLGQTSGLELSNLGIGNYLAVTDEKILENIQLIQEVNELPKAQPETIEDKVTYLTNGLNFSVEMETGTGKTYVYLRTIFELNKNYGFKKFIIVVPSIAIREGVLKSIEIMKDHFAALYGNVPFNSFVYDSQKLGSVRQFATSNQIQVMVINIDSFRKDIPDKEVNDLTEAELKKLNVIHREHDKMDGRKPIEFMQATNPIVIIDEPQSVDNTPKAKRAIANLNPMCTLRYSATHRNPYNLLYSLDPVKAYDLRLVKKIEVSSVLADDDAGDAYVSLLAVDNKKGIKAQIEFLKKTSTGRTKAKAWVKQGDDLFKLSGELEDYRNGYQIENIDCTPDSEFLEFNTGKFIGLGETSGGYTEEIIKAQIRETVEQHLNKEWRLRNKGIKVLSLFFIDRVFNYRIYNDDGTTSLGKLGEWFEEAYKEISKKPRYKGLNLFHVKEVHGGYFSKDNKGIAKDTSGKTKADEDIYGLIMKDKEKLLDPGIPLRFIFSHSALREGWDNPNVFQICTLNETQSAEKKRQEIGRGLRLPVNTKGERVKDDNINRLTVIANESYEDFARKLQSEFEDDFGIKFGVVEQIAFSKLMKEKDGEEAPIGQEVSKEIWKNLVENGYLNGKGEIQDKFSPKAPGFELHLADDFTDLKAQVIDEINKYVFKNRVGNAKERKDVKFNKQVRLSDDFQELWEKIKARTRYRVEFSTEDLIKASVERIKKLEEIKAPQIRMQKVELDITKAGVETDTHLGDHTQAIDAPKVLPDILAFLQKETELTRHTLVEILKQSGRLGEFAINPQKFMALVSKEIQKALSELVLEGIKYEKQADQEWEMTRIDEEAEEGITRYLSNLYKVQNTNKALYDLIEFESKVEEEFARDLDNNEDVKLFVKLPPWFKIDTPVGPYNPDWAFVTDRDEKLYFVRETKSTIDDDELRKKETQKIHCGKAHFKELDVDFDVVTKLSEVSF